MKIEKKIQPIPFQRILDGDKKYELRLADFNCWPGDTLLLREYDPQTKNYTGRVLEKEVTFVIKTKELTFWKPEEVKVWISNNLI